MRDRLRPFPLLACSLSFAGFACAWPTSVRAQETPPPAHVAFADPGAFLDRDGRAEPLVAGIPFLPGDRLRTAGGRIEVLFPDGSALFVGESSSVDLLSATGLGVTQGRIRLIVSGVDAPADAIGYQIDTPVASVTTDGPGEYRLRLLTAPGGLEAELSVFHGRASLDTERGSVPLHAGEQSVARTRELPSSPRAFSVARLDAFDAWSASLRDSRSGTSPSAPYLPPDLRMYADTFDRYGAWGREPEYGDVWYPGVTADWRPYDHGYWSATRQYGWTWIGLDAWGWPTHHYGRWGFARTRWFWIPERRWAPAWVTWAAAPGYVSWCPLGIDNRPVFALSANAGNPWRSWVVVARSHFGDSRVSVHRHAVPRLPAGAPVVLQATAPVPAATPTQATAVPRITGGPPVSGASIGETAIPRGSGYVAYGRRSPTTGAAPPERRRGSVGVADGDDVARTRRSDPAQPFRTGQVGGSTQGPERAVGRPVAIPPAPMATTEPPTGRSRGSERGNVMIAPQDSSGAVGRRATDRSPSGAARSPYPPAQTSGAAGRAGQPVITNTPPPATTGRRVYAPGARGDAAVPIRPFQWPTSPPAPQIAVPRAAVPPSSLPLPAVAPPSRAPATRAPAPQIAVPRAGVPPPSLPAPPAVAPPSTAPATRAPAPQIAVPRAAAPPSGGAQAAPSPARGRATQPAQSSR